MCARFLFKVLTVLISGMERLLLTSFAPCPMGGSTSAWALKPRPSRPKQSGRGFSFLR